MEILLPHKSRLETDTGRIALKNHERSSFLISFCSPSLKSQDDSCSFSHPIFIPGRNKDRWQNHFPGAHLHLNGYICLQMWLGNIVLWLGTLPRFSHIKHERKKSDFLSLQEAPCFTFS